MYPDWVDVFPIEKCGIFQPAMLAYQRETFFWVGGGQTTEPRACIKFADKSAVGMSDTKPNPGESSSDLLIRKRWRSRSKNPAGYFPWVILVG